MKIFPLPLLALGTSYLLLAACISSPSSNSGVERIATDEVYDLTGKWNDIDSQQVAAKMVDSTLASGWLARWDSTQNPVVIIGSVRNNTSEHINTQLFVKDLEAELINSGRVSFVASNIERGQVRDERDDQQSNASEATMKRIAQETGADFMLIGSIGSSIDETSGTKVIYYLVSMELIHVESNIKAWVGTDRIKKIINKTQQKSIEKRHNTQKRLNQDW